MDSAEYAIYRAAIQGDRDAFETVIRSTSRNLFAIAYGILQNREEAEDVVQDVFLTLYRRPECFDPDRGTSRAWLLTVVRNRSLDHLRRRSVRKGEDLSELAERLPDPGVHDVLEELDAADRNQLLWQLVDRLPACQADLIRRAFVSGKHRTVK